MTVYPLRIGFGTRGVPCCEDTPLSVHGTFGVIRSGPVAKSMNRHPGPPTRPELHAALTLHDRIHHVHLELNALIPQQSSWQTDPDA